MKKIDSEFFINYASTGKHYDEVWRSYTGFEIFKEYLRELPNLESCLVLGSATGKILEAMDKECNLEPSGIELDHYAYEKSLKYKDEYAIFYGDMRDLITSMPFGYGIIYSNSLMYLNEDDVVPFLKECIQLAPYFFWYGSMEGFAVADEYRVTLKTYEWWNEKFVEAGYMYVPKRFNHRYLWLKK